MNPTVLFWSRTTAARSSLTSNYYGILKCGRWLGGQHPDIRSPAQRDRALAQEYASSVMKMRIGDWSTPIRSPEADGICCKLFVNG